MSTSKNNESDLLYTRVQLKELRESLGKTQQQFAKDLDVSRSYLNQLENGDREISGRFCRTVRRYVQEKANKHGGGIEGLPVEVAMSVEKWSSQAGVSVKEFIVLCLMNHGRTMLSEIIAGQIISEKADEILKEQKEREARERRDKGSGQS